MKLLTLSAISALGVEGVKLRDYPFILSHDAGTAYLEKTIVNKWFRTQDVGFKEQLQCGTRAFDLRVACQKDGTILFHHSSRDVKGFTMTEGVNEIKEYWESPDHISPNDPSLDLTLLYFSHIESRLDPPDAAACEKSLEEKLKGLAVPIFKCGEQQEEDVTNTDVAEIVSSHGRVVAIMDGCVNENWDGDIHCEFWKKGEENHIAPVSESLVEKKELALRNNNILYYDCKAGDDYPWQKFWSYWNTSVTTDKPAAGLLRMIQAHWQEDATQIEIGVITDSSLLHDNEKSQVNAKVAVALTKLPDQRLRGFNLLEMNNVCYDSKQVYDALERFRKPDNSSETTAEHLLI